MNDSIVYLVLTYDVHPIVATLILAPLVYVALVMIIRVFRPVEPEKTCPKTGWPAPKGAPVTTIPAPKVH